MGLPCVTSEASSRESVASYIISIYANVLNSDLTVVGNDSHYIQTIATPKHFDAYVGTIMFWCAP